MPDDDNPVLHVLRLALDVEASLYERALRSPATDPVVREVRRRCRARVEMVLGALRREAQYFQAQELQDQA